MNPEAKQFEYANAVTNESDKHRSYALSANGEVVATMVLGPRMTTFFHHRVMLNAESVEWKLDYKEFVPPSPVDVLRGDELKKRLDELGPCFARIVALGTAAKLIADPDHAYKLRIDVGPNADWSPADFANVSSAMQGLDVMVVRWFDPNILIVHEEDGELAEEDDDE